MQQHVLDDRIGTFAVLHDLVEIVAQRIRQFGYFSARLMVGLHTGQGFPQLVEQLSRDAREIVDKVERVFDLVCDARGQLTERSQLLCLH